MGRIYVAGPLSAACPHAVKTNIIRACQAGVLLIAKGHVPYIPHLSYYTNEVAESLGISLPYETWMQQDFVWLTLCDALLYLGSSPGADRELLRAMDLGKPIYRSIAEVPANVLATTRDAP